MRGPPCVTSVRRAAGDNGRRHPSRSRLSHNVERASAPIHMAQYFIFRKLRQATDLQNRCKKTKDNARGRFQLISQKSRDPLVWDGRIVEQSQRGQLRGYWYEATFERANSVSECGSAYIGILIARRRVCVVLRADRSTYTHRPFTITLHPPLAANAPSITPCVKFVARCHQLLRPRPQQ
jgi:hypothetical protein